MLSFFIISSLILLVLTGGISNNAFAQQTCHSTSALPDQECTPGVKDSTINQNNIDQTICNTHYSEKGSYSQTVRPPQSWTNKQKLISMKEYGIKGNPSKYEYDHLISIALGGAPKDTSNLWPQRSFSEPNSIQKDNLEKFLYHQVCNHKMNLADAQDLLQYNWYKNYQKYIVMTYHKEKSLNDNLDTQ